MQKYSIIFLIIIPLTFTISLPCPNNCNTCSSSSQCSSCSLQYFSSIINSTYQCLPCSQYCLQCTSQSICTQCLDPYVLVNNSCINCQIQNAIKCNNIVSASQCITGYYVSDNYCYNCLLNCASCNSKSDCLSCLPGYYLNSSILTCNFCPSNCLSCDTYIANKCLSCIDGYSLSSSYTCQIIICNTTINNCLYCLNSNICKQCNINYYWSINQNNCILGSAILCQYGAEGPFPNQCNNKCPSFSYNNNNNSNSNSNTLWCIPYKNININNIQYTLTYYYLYNHYNLLQNMLNTNYNLFLESSGEYSYPIYNNNVLNLGVLTSYYKVTIYIKYRTNNTNVNINSTFNLTISASTQQTIQVQNISLPYYSTSAAVYTFNTRFVHSNNLNITFKQSINLVQLLIKSSNCPTNCYRCLNPSLCEMCNSPQYVSSYSCVDNCTIYYHLTTNRTCVTTCPYTFYPISYGNNSKYCQPCASPCIGCIDSNKCLSCITNKYLLLYSCIDSCPDGYYANKIINQCMPCISPCKTCINQTNCLSCSLGYWDSIKNICTSQCSDKYYGNSTTNKCQLCVQPCYNCRNSSINCINCINGYYYYNYQCLQKCPDRFYPITNTNIVNINYSNYICIGCQPPCYTCSSSSICLTCSYNYLYNSSCISQCPQGYYSQLDTKICNKCSSQCKTCQIYSQCTSCYVGYCYLQGNCLLSCPLIPNQYYVLIQYKNMSNQTCICQLCNYPCKSCVNQTACTSCLEGFLQSYSYLCVSNCKIGQYANISTFQCDNCSFLWGNLCLECDSTQCTRCDGNYVLFNGTCVTDCPNNYYKSNGKCQNCVAPCLDCSSFSQCKSCIAPYLFSSGVCIIQCPFGKVDYYNSTSNMSICISCQLPCITCQNQQSTNCTMCQYGYFLYTPNHTCISQCSSILPLHTLYNQPITSTCNKCLFPCKTCTSQSSCLTCQIGYLTPSNKCQNCPYSTYPDTNSSICLPCPNQCIYCYNPQYCISCKQNYYLYNYTCISNTSICIQNGYYPIGKLCSPCTMPCLHCNISSINCLSCVTGYILYNNTCILQCPKSLYRSNNTCLPCDNKCQTCTSSAIYCLTCKNPYLLIINQMQCVQLCTNTTYQSGNTCVLCQYPCKQCISQLECSSCISGTLINNSCISTCPSGYYSDTNNVCQLCDIPCKECLNLPTTCKLCVNGYYLFNNTCITACPVEYFQEIQAQQCLQCLGLCKECISDINCTMCNSNLSFYYNVGKDYGTCVSQCPISYYNGTALNNGVTRAQCLSCLPQCLTCQNNTQCILCKNNKAQYNGQCFTECPQQMYSASGICKQCSAPCYNCTDTITCTSCMNNSYLLVGMAQCIVGQICPQGYYLIPGTRNCNSQCPNGYYYRIQRICNNSGCGIDQYKGQDMHCYKQCPNGYISDKLYKCIQCFGDQCTNGLFYDITVKIIKQQLFLYLIFTQNPEQLKLPVILLQPYFSNQIITSTSRRLLQQQQQQQQYNNNKNRLLGTINQIPQIRNITIQLFPQQSFQQQALTLTFLNALSTYQNPLQRPSKTIMLPGYDMYPQTSQISLGLLLLACAIIGLIRNPFMVDFAQFIYLLALIDIHYPNNLATVLQSAKLANLHGIFGGLQQKYATGVGKFMYVTDMGLLSNCAINLGIIIVGLFVFFIIFIVYQILKKINNYNKIQQYPNQTQINTNNNNNIIQIHPKNSKNNKQTQNLPQNNNLQQNKPTLQQLSQQQQSLSLKLLIFIQIHFIDRFKRQFLNRLIYFNYFPLSIFTISQFKCLYYNKDSIIDMISSILVFIILLILIIYPIYFFKPEKPKYTFLMVRKFVLAVALTLSLQNPTYMIGVAAVTFIMTSILVGAYAFQKWKVQTKFNAGMQISQAFLMIIFAVFCIIGQGKHTTIRMYLSWVIIIFIIVISLAFLAFSIFFFVLWACKKFRGIDYVQQWHQKAQKDNISVNNSDNNSQMAVDKPNRNHQKQTNDENVSKTITVQKLLASITKQPAKNKQNSYMSHNINKQSSIQPKNTQNNLFWTYNDNDEQETDKNQQKAPQMLIRCVNQFSDYDPKQNKHQDQQKQQKDQGKDQNK